MESAMKYKKSSQTVFYFLTSPTSQKVPYINFSKNIA